MFVHSNRRVVKIVLKLGQLSCFWERRTNNQLLHDEDIANDDTNLVR